MARASGAPNKKGKDYRKTKNRKAISQRDMKKTKINVQKMNQDDSLTSEVFDLNEKECGRVREKAKLVKSLNAKTLQKDQQKDKELKDEVRALKREMEDNLNKQIEEMSGFSL